MKIGQNQARQAEALKQQGAAEAKQQLTTAQSVTPGTDDVITQLQKLADLHKYGMLTAKEFAAAKKKLLG
jgi:hypothetical protein